MGKSTTAGAFYRAGHQTVSDDSAALAFNAARSRYEVLPAFPQLKLWPESAAQVVEDPDQLRPLHSRVDKKSYSPEGSFPTDPLPLRGLFVLDWGEQTTVSGLRNAEAFLHVVGHSFTHRYAHAPLSELPELFNRCRRLVESVAVYRLVRRKRLQELDAIVKAVFQHE